MSNEQLREDFTTPGLEETRGPSGELDPGEIWDLGGGAAERSLGPKGTQSREQAQKTALPSNPTTSWQCLSRPNPTGSQGRGAPGCSRGGQPLAE